MAEGFHPPVEEYLESIHALEEEGVDVIQARLVERLGYSPQAISEMVRRLVEDGYLVKSGRGLGLSEKGHARAESVVRRHRLAERFLVDVVGLPWHKAHEEAGLWEHVISDDVEARFVELLGHPTTCPHGNPIPGSGYDPSPQISMADAGLGSTVRLERITEKVEVDLEALTYLSNSGLVPGSRATVRSRTPDGTSILEVEGAGSGETVAVGASLSRQLFVVVA